MAIVRLKCPETGKPVDVWQYTPGSPMHADRFSKLIPCPHCGKNHAWTSRDRATAVRGLNASPDATRVLVEHRERDAVSATALP
jgi:endogenous inhibitor of DNA gyrase (YacG/DUF329 family)